MFKPTNVLTDARKLMSAGKFIYTAPNPYLLLFRLWTSENVIPKLTRVLSPIGYAIRKSKQYLDTVAMKANQDWLEIVTDEETEIIENLLGTAFVVCQTHITLVVSSVKRLHKVFQKSEGRPLSGLEESKDKIMRLGATPMGTSAYTDIQVIDAFANYFKHLEEWPHDWTKLKRGLQQKTGDIIVSAGARSGSTGNLRTGAEVLGNSEYHQVEIFADRINSWHRKVREEYEAQLKTEKVI